MNSDFLHKPDKRYSGWIILAKEQELKISMAEMTDFFQKEALECRRLAAQATKENDRDYWLRLAQRWEWLVPQNVTAKVKTTRPTTPTRSVLEKRFAKRPAARAAMRSRRKVNTTGSIFLQLNHLRNTG
jgi:hypothetical protein